MKDVEIKYWNRKRGDESIKGKWDTLDKFYSWLDEQEKLSGQFTVRVNGGYSKNKKDGMTTILDFKNSHPSEMYHFINTVVK